MTKKSTKNITDENLKYTLILVTAISLLLSVAVVFYFQKYNEANQELQTIKTGYELKSWAIGQEVETPDFKITVNSVKKDEVGIPKYLPTPEGFMFVTLDLNVTNKTSEDKLFLPVNNTYLRDNQGNKYSITASPQVEETIAGSIAVGDTAHGQIGYLVPTNVDSLKFYFEPYGENGGNTVAIDLDINM
jgi:hypothetical protein